MSIYRLIVYVLTVRIYEFVCVCVWYRCRRIIFRLQVKSMIFFSMKSLIMTLCSSGWCASGGYGFIKWEKERKRIHVWVICCTNTNTHLRTHYFPYPHRCMASNQASASGGWYNYNVTVTMHLYKGKWQQQAPNWENRLSFWRTKKKKKKEEKTQHQTHNNKRQTMEMIYRLHRSDT